MQQEEIIIGKDNIIIAKIIFSGDRPENLHFYSEDKDLLQVASWRYSAQKHLKAHGHKICDRPVNRTSEFIYIEKGKLKVSLYDEDNTLLQEKQLQKGDMMIIFAGGHAYDILEDDTLVIEVKNGPYPGLELDKKIIEL